LEQLAVLLVKDGAQALVARDDRRKTCPQGGYIQCAGQLEHGDKMVAIAHRTAFSGKPQLLLSIRDGQQLVARDDPDGPGAGGCGWRALTRFDPFDELGLPLAHLLHHLRCQGVAGRTELQIVIDEREANCLLAAEL
jgi:hypothetical protein